MENVNNFSHQSRSKSLSPEMQQQSQTYHSHDRVQYRRSQAGYDTSSTMESILRGQAKFAEEERRRQYHQSIPQQHWGYDEYPAQPFANAAPRPPGSNRVGYEVLPPFAWGGAESFEISSNLSGLISSTSSSFSLGSSYGRPSAPFVSAEHRHGPGSFRSQSFSAATDYGSSSYSSREEIMPSPFSPRTNWQAPSPSTSLHTVSKSPKNASQRDQTPPDGFIYQVQFKRAHKNYILAPSAPRDIIPGDFVKVEADRGEDMGIVLAKIPVECFEEVMPTAGYRGRGFSAGPGEKKYLFRLATPEERAALKKKVDEEEKALEMIREKVAERGYPMQVLDAEFQFDRHKLTFYFEAERRIDFRELVSELFSFYKTRIWMQQVDTSSISFHDAGAELAKATGFLPDRVEKEFNSKRSSFSQSDETTKDGYSAGRNSFDQTFPLEEPTESSIAKAVFDALQMSFPSSDPSSGRF